jgi:hypothetical protein
MVGLDVAVGFARMALAPIILAVLESDPTWHLRHKYDMLVLMTTPPWKFEFVLTISNY